MAQRLGSGGLDGLPVAIDIDQRRQEKSRPGQQGTGDDRDQEESALAAHGRIVSAETAETIM